MKLVVGLWLLLFLSTVSVYGDSIASQSSLQSYPRSPGRSLLSISAEPTALVAALDGTIHLVENNSKRVIWSFSSGPPIYSAFHQQPNHKTSSSSSSSYYIDCGDDWELYLHYGNNGTMKLPVSIEEFLLTTPLISEDGAVTVGSKKTTVFEVDPKGGRLIRSYETSDSLSTLEGFIKDGSGETDTTSETGLVQSNSNEESPAKTSLKILRTDYFLKSYVPDSDKVSWSMTIAEIAAALLCQGVEKDVVALPMPCQSKALVFRHRGHVLLESANPEGLTGARDRGVLSVPASVLMVPSGPKENVRIEQTKRDQMLPVLSADDEQNRRIGHYDYALSNSVIWSIALTLGAFLGILVYHFVLRVKGKILLVKMQPNVPSPKASSSKKKKNRKQEKSNSDSSLMEAKGVNEMSLDLNKLLNCGGDGRKIGKLVVSNMEIAKGSNGTVVHEGFYDGRPVAVKCLVKAHHVAAFKEIQNLIVSDRHPNIVRWFGVEHDQYFVYLSLERCTCSLDDLIQIYSDFFMSQASTKDHTNRASVEHKDRLESIKNLMPVVECWKASGHPSPLLLKLMRDAISGLVHLHHLGIIHRDLKPQNVLITKEVSLCAKLSDMGISKRLHKDMSALDHQVTGCGSSGWQAPEQLLQGRQTRAVDLFSLGCVLFYCVTGGRHPFGDGFERDANIVNNRVDLFLLESLPEAIDLISRLLSPEPELRPKALEVLCHPLFWDSETRLSFLRDTSDRVELEDRESSSRLLQALESVAPIALGSKWNEKMEHEFMNNIGSYRRYKYDSVRDLLRVMRNKLNHYRELPKDIQELVGAVPEGFDGYFASRFPRLLIEVYKIISLHCREEDCFQKYYNSNVE